MYDVWFKTVFVFSDEINNSLRIFENKKLGERYSLYESRELSLKKVKENFDDKMSMNHIKSYNT